MTEYPHQLPPEETDDRLREARAYRRATLVKRIGIGALTVAVLALLVSMGYVLVQVRGTQIEGSPSSKRIIVISNQVASCTTPQGKCSKDNAKKTGEALGSIADTTAYQFVCSLTLPPLTSKSTDAQLTAAVQRLRACTARLAAVVPKP